jgi:hypothetical protein
MRKDADGNKDVMKRGLRLRQGRSNCLQMCEVLYCKSSYFLYLHVGHME